MGKFMRDFKTYSKYVLEHLDEYDADKDFALHHKDEIKELFKQSEIERKQAKQRKFEQEEEQRRNAPDYYKIAIGRFDLLD